MASLNIFLKYLEIRIYVLINFLNFRYELQDLELEAKISASSIAPRESNV